MDTLRENKGFYETEYYDIPIGKTTDAWRYALFTANGETGIVESMSPFNDVIIYNNTKFVMDTSNPMETAEFSDYIEEVKKNALKRENITAWTNDIKNYWHNKYGLEDYGSCGSRSYFPAGQLRIETNKADTKNYDRATDFETGEISFNVIERGTISRRSFVSRESGIAVTYSKSEQMNNYVLSFDNIYEMGIDGKIGNAKLPKVSYIVDDKNGIEAGIVGEFSISHIGDKGSNPKTELSGAGYAVATQILTDGKVHINERSYYVYADGRFFNKDEENRKKIKIHKKYINIQNARNIMILTKADYDKRKNSCKTLYKRLREELLIYIEKNKITACENAYQKMLIPHAKLHGRLFHSASVDLFTGNDEQYRYITNKELHNIQQRGEHGDEYSINNAWLNRLYDNSRYAMICSHGYSTARLGGIWIGNFMASWGGDHTVNANTNAQVSGINTGNLPECTESYINFVLDYAPDWIDNASKIHGMKNAIKAPARTDGAGCGAIYSTPFGYPMIFWNAGAAWQLLPIFEYWECYGNRPVKVRYDLNLKRIKRLLDLTDERTEKIEETGYFDLEHDILKPLIEKLINFWLQYADKRFYIDENEELHINDGTLLCKNKKHKYIFTPGYSPENAPEEKLYNTPGTVAANCTMDIAAARDSVRMARRLIQSGVITSLSEQTLDEFEWHIPEYSYNSRGALKEWSLAMFGDHDNHRHSSHLYPAWPAYEAEYSSELAYGIKQAIKARRIYAKNERTTGFGRMQLAMAAARIRDKELFAHCLFDLVGADFEYPSLMTSHDMGLHHSAFCTDNAMSIHGVINEALVYSDDKQIRLLPCSIWDKGKAEGIMTRCGIKIAYMSWNEHGAEAVLENIGKTSRIRLIYKNEVRDIKIEKRISIKFDNSTDITLNKTNSTLAVM